MTQTLFISYSHKDEKHKDYVVSHLGVAEKQGLLKTWDDRRIKGGGDWRGEIEAALAQAKVAILLVTHHSLTSDFILDDEVSTMLRRRDQEGLVVYPIVIRACDWEAVDWLKAMNLRPEDGKPLALFSLAQRDQVMAGISKEVRGFLDDVAQAATPSEMLDPSPVDDEIDRLAEQMEALSAELGTTKDALNGMFEILAEQKELPVDQLEAKLREIAERHVELTRLWQALPKSNDDPEITLRREQATQALEAGDYDQAAELLEEARSIIRQARQEHQEALDRSLLGEASIFSQQGQLERTRLNFRKAAGHFAEAASLVPATNDGARLEYLMEQASVLDDHGREFGDNPAVIEAIGIYRAILKERSHEPARLNWARTQKNLGIALRNLGERTRDTDMLEQAAKAFHAALKVYTREHKPLDWAGVQMSLGNVLLTLGLRESGTEKVEQAVMAYHAALEKRTRERVPLDWARTQVNLGNALSILGERKGDASKLAQAVEASRAALEVYTRDNTPLDWAKVQTNLGNLLLTLGQQESSTEKLGQAITAFHFALEVCTRERVPLDWARIQMNIGITLEALGERENDMGKLEQAIQAHHLALAERTRERVPLDWAKVQMNIGIALNALGEREDNMSRLEQSVEAFHAALEVCTRECVSLRWAQIQNYLGNTLKTLGERTGQTAHLKDALQAVKNASDVYLKEAGQMQHAASFQEQIEDIKAAIARRA